jgi:glutamine synthetase
MSFYRAEYIWIDGTKPTAKLRSKTKIVPSGERPPIWGFDGSSTNQAPGKNSDCVLRPVLTVPDPLRGGDNKLVLAEVLLTDMTPHPTNTRAACLETANKYKKHDMWFGIEQEYTFFQGARPLGWPDSGFPAPQGGYYCGVGADEVFGRDIVEAHTEACLRAGIHIVGTNAEVMPGQWEFQIGAVGAPDIADELWLARWLLYRIGEDFGISATLYPKPVRGDWNGAGAHTNFSTKAMREDGGINVIREAMKRLESKHDAHIDVYGAHNEERLTGLHETSPIHAFRVGDFDRGASVRIPMATTNAGRGYFEDRRPAANMDPYQVCAILIETVCGP